MGDTQDRQDGNERFFSVKTKNEDKESLPSSLAPSNESETNKNRCLTLRFIQFLLPCIRSKGVWEPSQGNVFKSHDAEESKYPRTLKILESRIVDVVFVSSCLLSIYLFLFSEGFLLESRLLWGIIHVVNAIYALGLFAQWLQILIKSKYAKTNHGYTTRDIVYTLLSVFPADLIVLVIFTLNDDDGSDEEEPNPIEHWVITISRLNYFLRIRNILQYFSKWENHLVVGDFKMFMLRTFLFSTFLIHMFACIWHRLACNSFKLKHFLMTPDEATVEVCSANSWIGLLKANRQTPLLNHPDWHVLITHYLVSVYWTIITTFRLGASDIKTSLISTEEVTFVVITQLTAWIYVLANVNGTLTSLLIEKDTEKENFLTRCFAIRHYLNFEVVGKAVHDDVKKYYNYLWEKSRGILNLDLVDVMPNAMKSEVYYDVNKFVLDQLPMLKNLETPFLMSLSVHTNHKFHLKGEILYKKNDTAHGLYYIVKGFLEILSDDGKHVIATIRSNSAIGEVHLLQPCTHCATVRCGSDCDILVLSRKHFKRVLNIYPQYIPTLEQRLENRLEQSGLLLALCEKHNTYHKAFKSLRDFRAQGGTIEFHQLDMGHSFENVTKILDATNGYEDFKPDRVSSDFDGLNVNAEVEARLSRGANNPEKKSYEELLGAAYASLEADVARAGSLASDLNIPRPPLKVTAPDTSTHVTLRFTQIDSTNVFVNFYKHLKSPTKGRISFGWKFLVSVCALLVFWYYPYQFAFRRRSHIMIDYVAHLVDFIFFLDCVYDMIQIVVTPQKTFESIKDITIYRFKSIYFYIRVLSFIPIEYFFLPFVSNSDAGYLSPYFYIFKFNRLLEIHLVFRFLADFETRLRMPPIVLFMGKYALGLFFVTHVFTVVYTFVLRDITNEAIPGYRHAFYWAIVVVTSTGYGDLRAKTNAAVAVEAIGLIVGVSTVMFMGAKVSSILVNTERRRILFKQTYYGLQDFMKQRKFPKRLSNRVREHYKLQWRSHEGTLIPRKRNVIWDAPKSLIISVSSAHALKFITKIPLFMSAPTDLQNEFCVALKQFIVPPGEVVLSPGELVRNLYIISKGSCEVIHNGKIVGIFSEGRYFGLNGLLHGVNTPYLFRTLTHCQLLCLQYEIFYKLVLGNPNFLHEFRVLTGLDQLSHYQTDHVEKEQLLPYPPENFISELDERSPPDLMQSNNGDPTANIFLKKLPNFKVGKRFYIEPNSVGLAWWTAFRVTAAVLATVFAPMQAFYSIPPLISLAITMSFDFITWIDIIVSMRVAYFGRENQLVTNNVQMAKHYIHGPFLIDVLASLPIDLLVFIYLRTDPDYMNLYYIVSLLRLNRMLQCYKLFLTCQLLEKTVLKSLTFLTLLEMTPVMVVFINVTASLSILAVCGVSYDGKPILCQRDSWIMNAVTSLDYSGTVSTITNTLTDSFRTYCICIYWVLQTILCVGFGDISIGTNGINQAVAITVIFFGVMMAAFVGGKFTSCIVGEDPARIALQEKMKVMNEYLEQHRVSRSLRRRVLETYFNAWDKSKGVSPENLFLALPPTLKMDVLKQLYEPALRASPLFKDLDGPGIGMLATSLTEIFYPEGEFLMKFGDLSNDIFFIAQGVVVCYNVRGDVMSQMGSGSVIGEIAAFFHTHRLYSAIALKDVNAYVFKKDSFMSFLAQYPTIKKIMEQCSVRHYKEAMMGTKKIGNVDFEVLLTYQNEVSGGARKNSFQPLDSLLMPGAAGEVIASLYPTGNKHGKHTALKKEADVTRNLLKEDVLKTPDDLAKLNTEKWWNVFVTFGRMARDEMGLVHIYQELGQCNIFNFTVHPTSAVCSWVSFCLVLTAMSCSVTAYEIAFSTGNSIESTPILLLRYLLEIFYIVRFIGNFHLGYYDETTTLIVDVKTISRRYMMKPDGMWLDLVTTFPFYIIGDIFTSVVKPEYMRSVQLLRVFLFLRYLNETDNDLKMKASRVKILKITILLCFIFHFWACAWYLISCYEITCSRGSWMHKTLDDLTASYQINPQDVSTAKRYVLSLYYVTTALTYTGYDEITARTTMELVLSICMMFGTVFVIGYLVGEMTQCLASQVATKIHYQHKLSVLENHFTTLGLSYTKIAEVRHYFKLLWCRCKGVMLYNLMEELPYPLRADVAMEIYGLNLKSSRILGKLDENLIRQICARIRHEIYFPGSHLIRAGDVCTSMYFIKKGEVVILDGNSNIELCVEVLYENECFGEVKILLPREQYRFSYIARLESEVGVLHKEDLENVLKSHPKIFDELKEKANRVKSRRQSIKEEEDKTTVPVAPSSLSIKSAASLASTAKKDTTTK